MFRGGSPTVSEGLGVNEVSPIEFSAPSLRPFRLT
jgi:hypothetical protein